MSKEILRKGSKVKPSVGAVDADFKEKQDKLIKENKELRAELEKTNSAINLLIGGEVEN